MTNITNYPLEDNFKTTLSQSWDGSTGTVNVAGTPNFTFPSGVTTYIVVDPGKSNMQVATINAYDAGAKTLTVSDITLEKGASVNSTAQSHAVGAEVIISDNYQFWLDIYTAVNTKVDGDTQPFPSYTTTNRDLISASNGMMIYNTTTGELNQYIGGAWSAVSAGSTQSDASTTVAGKVELATDAEITAGTATGGTGATLVTTATQANKLVNLATTDTTSDETDYYMFSDAAASDVNKKILKSDLRNDLAASTTVKGTVEMATDAEAAAGTDETRYINSKQGADNWLMKTDGITFTKNNNDATTTTQYSHNLGRIPKLITFHCIDATNQWSNGSYDGTTDNCVYATGTPGASSSNSISIRTNSASGGSYQTGTVSDMTTTTFDIDWTRVGSPTNTSAIHATLIG